MCTWLPLVLGPLFAWTTSRKASHQLKEHATRVSKVVMS